MVLRVITINAAVIHELKKLPHTKGTNSATAIPRQSLHNKNTLLEEFVNKIDSDSRTSSKSSSKCAIFTKTDTFGNVISNYFRGNDHYNIDLNSFLELTVNLLEALKVRMSNMSTATGGHIPILWYTRGDIEYLLIGLVNPSSGFTIDANGSIVDNTNVDRDALRFSLRIELKPLGLHHETLHPLNLDAPKNEEGIKPYARWTRKNDDIAHYFQEYLPIDQLLNDGKETRRYVNLFNEYLNHIIPDSAPPEHKRVRFLIKQEVYQKMDQKRVLGDVVRVEEDIVPIFQAMIESHPSVFDEIPEVKPYHEYCEDNGYEDYNSIFHPKKADLDQVLNVNISIGDNLTMRGSKESLTSTTHIVASYAPSGINTYKLVTDMTLNQYNDLTSKVPEIEIKKEDFITDEILTSQP